MNTENRSKHDRFYLNWYNQPKIQRLGAERIVGFSTFLQDLSTPGVYQITYEQSDPETGMVKKSLVAGIGESRDCAIRAIEHSKRWIGSLAEGKSDYFNYYTGIEDLSWKIKFTLIASGEMYRDDSLRRIEREREALRASNPRPFLQDTRGGKYPLYTPRGPEDCHIAPFGGARTRAFKEALSRKYGENPKTE